MPATVMQTSQYTEGGDRVRRFQISGDTSYPTGGYPLLPVLQAIPGNGLVSLFRRVLTVRHRTVASAALGMPVVVDSYTGGGITGLNLALVINTGEQAAGTNTSALNVEIALEGN